MPFFNGLVNLGFRRGYISNGESDLSEGAEVWETRVGRALNHSLADVGRRATVTEFSDQLFAKKDPLSLDWYATPSSKRGPYFAHSH